MQESHPLQVTITALVSSFSNRLIHPNCEGEVSQVLPSCCGLTLQPALLPIDQACALCHKITHFSVFCTNQTISHTQMFYYSTTHCHTAYTYTVTVLNIIYIQCMSLFLFLTFVLYCLFFNYCLLQCHCPAAVMKKFPHLWDK